MTRRSPGRPPRLSRALLRLLAPPADRPYLLDDLEEEYGERVRTTSPRRARRWYRAQALSSLAPLLARRLHLLRTSENAVSFDSVVQDVRFAVRSFLSRPGFAGVAVVTIGLALGANTALFSVVNGILLGPVPGVTDTGDLVEVTREIGGAAYDIAWPIYSAISEEVGAFESVAGFNYEPVAVGGEGAPVTTLSLSVTPTYFDVLRLEPSRGRFFSSAEATPPDVSSVVVISEHFWHVRLGADPDVVGRTLRVNGSPMRVVGVAASGFRGHVRLPVDVFVPFGSDVHGLPSDEVLADPESGVVEIVARLAPGASREVAAEATSAVANRLLSAEVGAESGAFTARVHPWGPIPAAGRGPVRVFLLLLMTVVGLVLVMACVNVAGMLLSRSTERHGEIALRRTLGATSPRIARQLLTESIVLFVVGGALGLGLSTWLTRLLMLFDPPLPPGFDLPLDLGVDGRVLAYSLLLTVCTAVLFNLRPALRAARSGNGLMTGLSRGGRGGTSGGSRARNLLVGIQVAGCLVLLVVAGLFVRSLDALETLDPGWNAERVITAELDLSLLGSGEAEGRRIWRSLQDRLARLPAVESVALASRMPLSGRSSFGLVRVPGREPPRGRDGWDAGVGRVSTDFLRTLEVELLEGRHFGPEDGPEAPLVAVVNRHMAELIWPNRSAVGATFLLGPENRERRVVVVGVAENTAVEALGAPPEPFYWLPAEQWYTDQRVLFVKVAGAPGSTGNDVPFGEIAADVRATIEQVVPDLPAERVMPMDERLALYLLPQRLAAWVTGLVGLFGLGLAAVGVYGVTAFAVRRQVREIGVRLALGARPRDELTRVIGRSMVAPLAGLVLGGVLAAAVAVVASRFLATVPPTDPAAWSAAVTTLLAAALLAAVAPAVRAVRRPPMESLRVD